MSDYQYDVLVIGSGPSGEAAAISSSKNGSRVGIVESREVIGGNCLHKGTIPSKSLRHVIEQVIQFNSNEVFRKIGDTRSLTYPEVLSEANKVISQQVDVHSHYYAKNRVKIHTGLAQFVDTTTVEFTANDGQKSSISADNIIIATGSRPYQPADIDFNHPRVYDSDSILTMSHTPRNMVIYGAGVIGCEYASMFAGLGIKVDLINTRDQLLSFLDDEISDALSYHLREMGVMVRHLEEYDRVEASDDSVTIHLKSGKRLRADAMLWSNGRSGNTESLGLENIGLEADHRGQLAVNDRYQTSVDNVYAVGDVIGWPSLASASYDQGRAVADAIQGEKHIFVNDIPTGIYTLPEISSLGKTERELTDAKIPYEVGRAFFKHLARAQISGDRVGMLKILFDVNTFEILGIHCFGSAASEIIHIGQAIMKQKGEANNIHYFVNTTFNYPTMAEAYRVAALAGINRVKRFHS